MPNFSWAKPNSKWGQAKQLRLAQLIHMPILIPGKLNQKGKNALGVKVLAIYFIVIYALGLAQEKFGVWIEAVLKLLQWRSSRPG